MARIIGILLTAVLCGLTSSAAYADNFGVTLRYWLTEESAPGSVRLNPFLASVVEDTRLEVPAITLRWSPDWWANTDILLSYFKLDSARKMSLLLATSYPATLAIGDIQTKRSDIELLARSRVSDNFFFYYGTRYINPQTINDLALGVGQRNIIQIKEYLAEFGLGLALPVSENGRHSLFANAIGGIGHFSQEGINQTEGVPDYAYSSSATGHTIDLNFGYQYTMNQTTSLSLRYRDWSSYYEGDKQLGSAGIDLGVTVNF